MTKIQQICSMFHMLSELSQNGRNIEQIFHYQDQEVAIIGSDYEGERRFVLNSTKIAEFLVFGIGPALGLVAGYNATEKTLYLMRYDRVKFESSFQIKIG